jgi:hypothetical protein
MSETHEHTSQGGQNGNLVGVMTDQRAVIVKWEPSRWRAAVELAGARVQLLEPAQLSAYSVRGKRLLDLMSALKLAGTAVSCTPPARDRQK